MPKNEELENKIEDNKLEVKKVATTEIEDVQNEKNSQKKSSSKTKVSVKDETKVNESAVIEKIKSFIAKIAAMQEEALDEEKDKAETKKEKKIKVSNQVKEVNTPQYMLEYYDLPYKYGNTVVRLLAQTPKTLFVYWEVSEKDIENFKTLYGDDFFSKTKPVLIVHNLTLNKINEIEINDFANCWYLNTEDSDCKFDIELARKFIDNTANDVDNTDNYLYIAKSNNLQSPNNHILFEKIQEFVVFRNASNDNIIKKNIKSFKFLKDIYKFYKDMYDEDVLNNPSSQFKF